MTVTSGSVPSSNKEKLSSGDYYWQASYSGDSENPAATSACGTEVAIVRPLKFQYAALGDSFSAGVGGGTYYAKTNTAAGENENKCYRSSKAYPARVAEAFYPGSTAIRQKQKSSSSGHPNSSSVPATAPWHGTCGVEASRRASTMSGSKAAWRMAYRPGPEPLACTAGRRTRGRTKQKDSAGDATIGGNDAGFATVGENCINSSNVAVTQGKQLLSSQMQRSDRRMGNRRRENVGPETPDHQNRQKAFPSIKEPSCRSCWKNIHERPRRPESAYPLYPQIIKHGAEHGAHRQLRSSRRLRQYHVPRGTNSVADGPGTIY